MSTPQPETVDRPDRPIDVVGGFISAAALVAGALALVQWPIRIGVFGVIAALVAAGIGGRHARLAMFAVLFCTTCWVVGMVIAILTHNPLW
jgi:hypothetical protein